MTDEATTPSKTLWEADSTHPQVAEAVRTALREVVDPEIGLNIIELGLVRDLRVGEGEVQLKMILTTPFCPYGPAMLEMTRTKAEGAASLPTRIDLGMDIWDPSLMEEGAGAAWGLY